MFKELFTEAVTTIYMKKNAKGSSHCQDLSSKEQEAVLDALYQNKKSDSELLNFLYGVKEKEKYSDTIVIVFSGLMFSLYAASGKLRLGAGGVLSECKLVKNVDIMKLSNELRNAKVK